MQGRRCEPEAAHRDEPRFGVERERVGVVLIVDQMTVAVRGTVEGDEATAEQERGTEPFSGREAGRALSPRLPDGRGVTASRHAHLHIDLARASLLHGDRERTLAELVAARRSSPQITRYHPQALDVLRTLALKDRRSTRSRSAFARWAGARI